ncbi:YaaA family protein [Viscerimonas tarda]
MIIILSPSKSIDFKTNEIRKDATLPQFQQEACYLMSLLSGFRADEIAEREKTSLKIALDTYWFIQTFPSTPEKEAVFAYSGNAYSKLNGKELDEISLLFLQKHLRILSALYGILRPLDKIKPYRLDMNSKLISDLYGYWKNKVTATVAGLLKDNDGLLVNLASVEYFKMLDLKALPKQTRIITPVFQQEKNGKLVSNSLFAKQARGLMLRFIAENQITEPTYLQAFDSGGYFYNPRLSNENDWYFTR